jgi:hypothetical protein
MYPSENPRLAAERIWGNTSRHVLTQECADDDAPLFPPETPGRCPRLVGGT